MAYIKGENEKEQQYFNFLENLRQSGATNMFGASPYLVKAFPELAKKDKETGRLKAVSVLSLWMKLHNRESRIIHDKKD